MRRRSIDLPTDDLGTHARMRALGDKVMWGRVAYMGAAFAPAPGTYRCGDAVRLDVYFSTQDSGDCPTGGRALSNLYPLIAASIYELGFAAEAGPLLTWNN